MGRGGGQVVSVLAFNSNNEIRILLNISSFWKCTYVGVTQIWLTTNVVNWSLPRAESSLPSRRYSPASFQRLRMTSNPFNYDAPAARVFTFFRTSEFHPHCLRHITFPPTEWPDLAKFRHLGKILKVFGHFSKVYLVFGKMFILLWQICNAFGQICSVVSGQILHK